MKPVFKLYQEDRCYGNQTKRDVIKKDRLFICENTNMDCITAYIKLHGDKTKTYTIFKYIGEDLRWRQLSLKNTKQDTFSRGDITTTWMKMYYNKKYWKETNFRYNDEIVSNRV